MKSKNTIIILGSSRSQGDTRKAANYLLDKKGMDLIDLNNHTISYYDYDHKNADDDFLQLMENIIEKYDRIIFATPVYWYTMSAVMKTFLDRISDLLTIRKELGRKLRGKSMGLISVSGDDDLDYDFEMPFRQSAEYLGMTYIGHVHAVVENEQLTEVGEKRLAEFSKQ